MNPHSGGEVNPPADFGEGSFLGLGYGATHTGTPKATTARTPSAPDTADDLMKHYLQQCLEYHEEQVRRSQRPQELDGTMTTEQAMSRPMTPTFVAAVEQRADSINDSMAMSPPQSDLTTTQTSPSVDPTVAAEAQKAAARARSLVQKFQEQYLDSLLSSTTSRETLTPEDYSSRRLAQFEKEQRRLDVAMRKNFEYVSQKEKERYQRQLLQLQQTRQMEVELQQQHAQQLLERKKQQEEFKKNQSLSGIGTSQRKRLEHDKWKKQQRSSEDESSVSIYFSGTPTDGSVTEKTIRDLFSSYGTLTRVRLYRNKQTNELKGDGLLVFCSDNGVEAKRSLLEAICSQMNGAELPCGSILHVEPATASYKGGNPAAHYGPTTPATTNESRGQLNENATDHSGNLDGSLEPTVVNQEATADEGEVEDLDDFFASLT